MCARICCFVYRKSKLTRLGTFALAVSALCALEPTLIADTVRRALLKSNCDVRLAKSFMKWGIV